MSTKSFVAKSAVLAALTFTVVGGGLAATPAAAGYKHHHHHGFRVIIGAPVVYGGYGYRSYHGHRPCYWLYRKARYTGSHYWWKRFHHCRYGH
jgi:hypothetical protein